MKRFMEVIFSSVGVQKRSSPKCSIVTTAYWTPPHWQVGISLTGHQCEWKRLTGGSFSAQHIKQRDKFGICIQCIKPSSSGNSDWFRTFRVCDEWEGASDRLFFFLNSCLVTTKFETLDGDGTQLCTYVKETRGIPISPVMMTDSFRATQLQICSFEMN